MMSDESTQATKRSPTDSTHQAQPGTPSVNFRIPTALDGAAITALIGACPPLDTNSAYCNLLQCTHFADTCIVAEQDSRIVGWISAYRPPSQPDQFFIWQVAVARSARGAGLGNRMLDALLSRPSAQGATTLITTITLDNAASWALFESFARRRALDLTKAPHFQRDIHFSGAHATEWQVRIGPLPASGTQRDTRKISETAIP